MPSDHPNAKWPKRFMGLLGDGKFDEAFERFSDDVVLTIPGKIQGISGTHQGKQEYRQFLRAVVEGSAGTFHGRVLSTNGSDTFALMLEAVSAHHGDIGFDEEACFVYQFGSDGLIHKVDAFLSNVEPLERFYAAIGPMAGPAEVTDRRSWE